ncbi:MAG: restriction endonuclease subunit S, partial [Desulfuromonadales bacterium]
MISSLKLKFAASINDEALPETTSPDYELQYIDIGNVDSNGTVHDVVTYAFQNAPSRARRVVRHGDVIVSTVRTYLQAIAAIENPPENLIVSTGFAVVRPKPVLHPNFCKYALREPAFIHEVVSRSVGISYPAINASELGDIPIPLPSFDQQEQIADVLDRETTRLDTLITAKENYLTLIAEKRRALITSAVTRGIDPMVRLKKSGIPWLGLVPEHWEVERAKWLFKERDIRSEFGDEEMLTVSHLT